MWNVNNGGSGAPHVMLTMVIVHCCWLHWQPGIIHCFKQSRTIHYFLHKWGWICYMYFRQFGSSIPSIWTGPLLVLIKLKYFTNSFCTFLDINIMNVLWKFQVIWLIHFWDFSRPPHSLVLSPWSSGAILSELIGAKMNIFVCPESGNVCTIRK